MRQISNVEVGWILLCLSGHLSLDALTLQLVDCSQCAGRRLEVHESVTLAPVSCLVQYGLCRNDGTKPGDETVSRSDQISPDLLLTQIDEVLVCGVRGETSDVEICSRQRLALLGSQSSSVGWWGASSSSIVARREG